MDIHKEKFMVRELATQTVTLYPTRAYVVRTIEDLSLKTGLNEITIYGITPTADENSIKFEGTGAATITDMTVDLVDNPEHFEEVYPSDSGDAGESDSDSTSDSDTQPPAIKDLTAQLLELEMFAKEATEERSSAQGRLNMLDNYARSLTTSRPDDIAACVGAYQSERAKAFESHKNGEARLKEYGQQIARLKAQQRKIQLKAQKLKAKADRAKTKDQEKKDRDKKQRIAEEQRIKQERMYFWPKNVYKVVLSLDANSSPTPTSSRRGSIDTVVKTPQPTTKNASDGSVTDTSIITLSFSYITNSASWSPRYDLGLDTTSKSGSINYRAEFRNTTSETWRDAKVVLSTSQTSFQGLGEAIPKIRPWHIRLAKGSGDIGNGDQALYSSHEHYLQHKMQTLFGQQPQPTRNALSANIKGGNGGLFGAQQPVPAPPSAAQPASGSFSFGHGQASSSGLGGGDSGGHLFGSSIQNRGSSVFGSSSSTSAQESGAVPVQPNIAAPVFQRARVPLADEDEADIDGNTLAPTEAALAFQESIWEESGLTAIYTVPGTKTIPPSNTTRRHKVASIPLSSVSLSHIIVPKLRAAAFLKARLRNGSSITLLKGPAGLTLDGTFLGTTYLPRSSPGEAFVLNLGVDPALNVVYGRPTVRRSESGMFQKEGCAIYTRTCLLTNTKNDATIEATVLDQVPVSEDERLKIEILVPRGLGKEGAQAVKAGTGQVNEGTGKAGSTYAEDSTGSSGVKWGKATAKMKKEGEVEWDVKLNPGQGVKLELEYEARLPSGTGVVGV
ncbi:MAG: hypothetical protein Q9172_001833 [Xanthocarpia lactea]